MPYSLWKVLLPALILCLGSQSLADEPPQTPSPPVIPNLHSLTHNAGYIFSGTVEAVERIAPRDSDKDKASVAVIRITFRIDSGIRGVRTGQRLVIREWAGLWNSGERYRPGQRVMLFLYPPSKLGLTSPVGGATGRFNIDKNGGIVMPGPTRPSSPALPRPGRFSGRVSIDPLELLREVRRAEKE